MTTKAMEFLNQQGCYGSWSTRHLFLRDKFIGQFGFAIIDDATIEELRPYGPILEVGAGCGYWTYELSAAGIDAIATDPETSTYFLGWNGNPYHATSGRWLKTWCHVETLTAIEAVRKYPDRTLLTVWPDLGHKSEHDWQREMLVAYRGNTVLYVGEEAYGCTGTEGFHEYLRQYFDQTDTKSIPQFPGLHDHLEIWNRKGE